jgi:aconitate hydratase
MPHIVGVQLRGALPSGSTATDLVLTVTERLRALGVVGSFVEFAGDGLAGLALADRATISNMSPEFGATATIFPIDDETLAYLRLTGRSDELVELVERYAKTQGLWRLPGAGPDFDVVVELDLASVEPSLAGPRRPQDRVPVPQTRASFETAFPGRLAKAGTPPAEPGEIRSGSVVIAAITSCTNTSNPTVMVGAGLLAAKAVARGLRVNPAVKTSLAPGSRAVTAYLERAGLSAPLAMLGFALAGYGCTTCIGNSGPLDEAVARQIEERELTAVAVLSGNRNFEGRIHPLARASYLASPPLVVAYALAGRIDIDLSSEPLGLADDGAPVFLADLWPSADEVRAAIADAVDGELFRSAYASVFDGDARWRALPIPDGDRYEWAADSTYVANPPFFAGMTLTPDQVRDIEGARVLAWLGDSVTTDHISPAGSIAAWSPAGAWLQQHGVAPIDFNSYGARRGHHEVMMRGTFGNIRLRNRLVDGKEGPYTLRFPTGSETFIYDAAMTYQAEGVPTIILAGREYGSGSSRDWAAKGTRLLGIRAVIAESFERIHRSNLVGMGVLPLQLLAGDSAASLGLTGRERYTIVGPGQGLAPRAGLTVVATADDVDGGRETRFEVTCRLDGPIEVEYYRQGGILPAVLRRIARESGAA